MNGLTNPLSETPIPTVGLRLKRATADDIPGIADLWNAFHQHLASTLGHRIWSKLETAEGVDVEMRKSTMYVAREEGAIVASFTLAMQKPWNVNEAQFEPAVRPLYLTHFAVHPQSLRQGVEQFCIRAAIRIARSWPCDALRLSFCLTEDCREAHLSEFGFRNVGISSLGDVPAASFELPIFFEPALASRLHTKLSPETPGQQWLRKMGQVNSAQPEKVFASGRAPGVTSGE